MNDLTAYEKCADLMQFYEVYCSKESGAVEGSINGVVTIFGMLTLWFVVETLLWGGKQKLH